MALCALQFVKSFVIYNYGTLKFKLKKTILWNTLNVKVSLLRTFLN